MIDDLISDLDVVLHNDPALDLSRMDLRRYLETRDASLIVEVPGLTAKRYWLRALDVVEASAVMNAPGLGSKVLLAVRHALVGVTPGPDGTAWRPAKETEDSFGKLRPMMDLHEINLLFVRGQHAAGSNALVEIGQIAIHRYESGNAAGGSAPYALPPQSEPVLERNARLRAELSRETSTTQTSG